jgi:hypothetical protein
MVSLQWRGLQCEDYLLNGLVNDTDIYASKQRHNGGKAQSDFTICNALLLSGNAIPAYF